MSAGRIPPDDLNQLLQPIFDPEAKRKAKVIAKGINAGPGAASGKIKFFADDAEHHVRTKKESVILVRRETSPEDIRGMQAADGILTAFGGASSHAALVSRQMGKVCIVGCHDLQIDYAPTQHDRLADRVQPLRRYSCLSIEDSEYCSQCRSIRLGGISTVHGRQKRGAEISTSIQPAEHREPDVLWSIGVVLVAKRVQHAPARIERCSAFS